MRKQQVSETMAKEASKNIDYILSNVKNNSLFNFVISH